MKRWARLIVGCCLLSAAPAYAGMLATAGMGWQTMAFRPLTDEPTPNYYGYAAEGVLGYSVGQILDLGLDFNYIPFRHGSASVGDGDVQYHSIGGTIGLRLGESVYMGVDAGLHDYQLLKSETINDVDGHWSGTGGNVTIAAVFPLKKHMFGQVGVVVGSATLERKDQSSADKRVIDRFGITMSYVFNLVDSSSVSGLFRATVGSLFE